MLLKPNLIDPYFLKKITQKHLKGGYIVGKLTNDLGQKLIDIFDTYKGLIIIVILLFLFLLFLHKFNKNNSGKKPNNIEINYNREVDYEDGKIINVRDSIEDEHKIPNSILNIVKKEVNDYDPIKVTAVDVNNMSNF